MEMDGHRVARAQGGYVQKGAERRANGNGVSASEDGARRERIKARGEGAEVASTVGQPLLHRSAKAHLERLK